MKKHVIRGEKTVQVSDLKPGDLFETKYGERFRLVVVDYGNRKLYYRASEYVHDSNQFPEMEIDTDRRMFAIAQVWPLTERAPEDLSELGLRETFHFVYDDEPDPDIMQVIGYQGVGGVIVQKVPDGVAFVVPSTDQVLRASADHTPRTRPSFSDLRGSV